MDSVRQMKIFSGKREYKAQAYYICISRNGTIAS